MVIVTTAVYWRFNSSLRLPAHWSFYRSSTGQASVHIRRLTTWHGPVFLVNSRFPLLSATTPSSTREGVSPVVAPLLPKLRGQFAEFLNHSSPDRLGILYLTTCVGFGYGPHGHSLEAFLGSMGSLYFASFGYASRLRIYD